MGLLATALVGSVVAHAGHDATTQLAAAIALLTVGLLWSLVQTRRNDGR
ncbi:MAG: hypothetical protein AAGC53_15870 [Actinomycetota bacterium]